MGAGVSCEAAAHHPPSRRRHDDATTEPTPALGTPLHIHPLHPAALMDETVTLLFAGHDTQRRRCRGRSFASPRIASARATSRERRRRPGRRRRPRRRRPPPDARARRKRERSGRGVVVASASAGVARVVRVARARGGAARDAAAASRGAARGSKVDDGRRGRRRHVTRGVRRGRVVARGAQGRDGVGKPGRVRAGAVADDGGGDAARETERRRSAKGTRRESLDVGDGLRVRFKGSAFMPFAAGPRACVGQHLAWVFMRVVLARLVCAYDVSRRRERTRTIR